MKTKLPESINTIQEAQRFLDDLFANREGYHLEDDSREIIWNVPSDQPTLTECIQLNKLSDQIMALPGLDPFDYILQLTFKQ